jgi:hypothetical protein
MSNNVVRSCKQFVVAALIALGQFIAGPCAKASALAPVTGTYEVMQRTAAGAQEHVRLRIHLVNQGSTSLSIQRMTLWNFSRPDRGATRPCAVTLRARGSAVVTLDFAVRRMDYERWQQGAQPRLIVQTAGTRNRGSKAVVDLDRISAQEVK